MSGDFPDPRRTPAAALVASVQTLRSMAGTLRVLAGFVSPALAARAGELAAAVDAAVEDHFPEGSADG